MNDEKYTVKLNFFAATFNVTTVMSIGSIVNLFLYIPDDKMKKINDEVKMSNMAHWVNLSTYEMNHKPAVSVLLCLLDLVLR